MTRIAKLLPAASLAALAASFLVVMSSPAQAEGVSSGRAVIRLDATSATVTKVGRNTYRMVLPEETTGQWMGERSKANGKRMVRVGDLTAGKLAKNWSNFRYGKSKAYTTLIWNNAQPNAKGAVVKLGQPTITSSGVRLEFTTREKVPGSMKNVTVNLARAPRSGDATRSVGVQTANMSGTMTAWVNVKDPQTFFARIFDSSGSGSNCWGGTNGVKVSPDSPAASVGSGTCAGIPYVNYVGSASGGYGVTGAFNQGSTTAGSTTFTVKVTPPGQASFQYNHKFNW